MEIKTDPNSIVKNSFIFAFLIGGTYFIIRGILNASVTGAVIGTKDASISILLGTIFFIGTLALTYHKDQEYKQQLRQR